MIVRDNRGRGIREMRRIERKEEVGRDMEAGKRLDYKRGFKFVG